MKTAIYIADGTTQFILTPEDNLDKKVLDELQSTQLKTYRGSFYPCQGGWVRWASVYEGSEYTPGPDDSLIFIVTKTLPETKEPQCEQK